MRERIVSIIFSLSLLLLPAIALAQSDTDTVTVNVNVSMSAQIEITPDTASFDLVTPGDDDFPSSLSFTITNMGSTNFTQMYVSVDVPDTGQEDSNPLGKGNPAEYYAGGFVVLKNETDLAGGTNNWRFVGRQEWNLTKIPNPYIPYKSTDAKAWGYFGNNSKQYFWELINGTNGYCNGTTTILNIKNWGVNGTGDAYNPSGGDQTTHTSDHSQLDWGIFDAESAGPLADYCVAARTDCTRIFIYQWDQSGQFGQCADEWTFYSGNFKPYDQFNFNITVWVPKAIPAGDTSSSTLTVTAS